MKNLPQSVTVAVVVPFFNNYQTLPTALESLRDQTTPPDSVVIVDDASSVEQHQALEATCRSFEDLPLRILRRSVNGGPSAARNDGWNSVDSTFVAFLDADDSWMPRKLQRQLAVLSGHPEFAFLGTTAAYLSSQTSFADVPTPSVVEPHQQLLRNRFVTSSVVLRADLPHRFDQTLRYSEDNELWCRILFSGGQGAVLEEDLTIYHKPLGSRQGASGKYAKMLGGQFRAFWRLRRTRAIGTVAYLAACVSATVRFVRRVAIAALADIRNGHFVRSAVATKEPSSNHEH